jgi:TonB-linked SusC/RagA family outer membrane protein
MKKEQIVKKVILSLVFLIFMGYFSYAQNGEITGRIMDEEGLPLPGVSVVIKGTTAGTVSNSDGTYSLNNVSQDASLVFSFVGMKTKEVVVGNQTTINVTLEAEAYSLAEVVAVGYGTQKKANLTGSVDMVTADRLENRPITNVGEGLQGLIPNLNVTIFSGDPTRSTDLNVRGFESINGGEPLILVDGVPMDLNRINPQDIESITVLKDAAAGAVYGARAAFGVIMVETKKGSGDINVRLSAELSGDVPIFNVDPLENGYEYALLRNQVSTRNGGTPYYNEDYMEGLRRYWEDPENNPPYEVIDGQFVNYEYTRLAKNIMNSFSPKQKYDLSVSGSTAKSSFYTSFGFLNTDGYLNHVGNDNFKRFNILMKGDFTVNDWLKIDQQITINSQVSDKPTVENRNTIIRIEPIRPHIVPYLEDYPELEGDYWSHGLTILPDIERSGRTKWSNIDTWLKSGVTLNPLKGLQIRSDFSFQLYNRQYEKAAPQYHVVSMDLTRPDPYDYLGANNIQVDRDHNQYYVFNTYAEYQLENLENHFLKVMVGFNQEWGKNTSVNGTAYEPVSASVIDVGATTGTQSINGSKTHVALRGAFYRLNYIYKDKYLFEANGRYDGTSRFPKKDRFGFFPSFSAAWRISNEGFMTGISHIFDDIKIRASYGTLGNQLLGSNYYPYIPSMNVTTTNFPLSSGVIPVVLMPGMVSPSLSWETVVSQNLGLDLTLIDQKLNASFDIYTRETKNMLMRKDYPDILGASAPNENSADLMTKGWEFSLKWRDRVNNDLSYDLAFSIADWQAEITKYDNPSGALSEYYVGQKLGEIWGYQTVGFINTEEQLANLPDQSRLGDGWRLGDLEFADLNNDGIISPGSNTLDDPGDRIIIGNNNPRYSFGLNAGIRYKDFSLAAFFQGIGKRDYYPSTGNWTWFFPWKSYNVDKSWIEDSWTPDNPDAYWPDPQIDDKNFAPQTKYLQNAAYVRVKSLTLSYDLPVKLTEKVGLNSAKIYTTGQNLWEFSKIRQPLDPEYVYSGSIDYPLLRTYSVGLIINF